jgi:hypothetical protein
MNGHARDVGLPTFASLAFFLSFSFIVWFDKSTEIGTLMNSLSMSKCDACGGDRPARLRSPSATLFAAASLAALPSTGGNTNDNKERSFLPEPPLLLGVGPRIPNHGHSGSNNGNDVVPFAPSPRRPSRSLDAAAAHDTNNNNTNGGTNSLGGAPHMPLYNRSSSTNKNNPKRTTTTPTTATTTTTRHEVGNNRGVVSMTTEDIAHLANRLHDLLPSTAPPSSKQKKRSYDDNGNMMHHDIIDNDNMSSNSNSNGSNDMSDRRNTNDGNDSAASYATRQLAAATQDARAALMKGLIDPADSIRVAAAGMASFINPTLSSSSSSSTITTSITNTGATMTAVATAVTSTAIASAAGVIQKVKDVTTQSSALVSRIVREPEAVRSLITAATSATVVAVTSIATAADSVKRRRVDSSKGSNNNGGSSTSNGHH